MINQTDVMIKEVVLKSKKVLKFNLGDYNDAYTLVRGDITVIAVHRAQVAFKNCAPFTKRITKSDGTIVDDAEDLDLVMSMFDLFEYSSSYSDTTCSLWFCFKDEATNFDIDNTNNFKSVVYKAKFLGTLCARPHQIITVEF